VGDVRRFVPRAAVGIPIGLVLVGGLAWLAFGFFQVHKLWLDDRVDEAAPTLTASAGRSPQDTAGGVDQSVAGGPVRERQGSFVSKAHDTSGTATVVLGPNGERFLRLEQFETSNGPDLDVYLVRRSTGDIEDHVNLGDLKGNIGNQNYAVPAGVDLDTYDRVVIWCVRFAKNFGEADLDLV
jgi:hypothetical protein